MMKMSLSLIAFALAASVASAQVPESALSSIREGVYIDAQEPGSACTVIVKDQSDLLRGDRFTVQVARQSTVLSPDLADFAFMDVTSDVFSMSQLKKQAVANGGRFKIVTKESPATKNEIEGGVFEDGGAFYWQVNVSKNTCLGLCSGKASFCTVRITDARAN